MSDYLDIVLQYEDERWDDFVCHGRYRIDPKDLEKAGEYLFKLHKQFLQSKKEA